ncbi:class F sortase [Spongiactinospora gelatinilytica]|uniref:Class F sortase n=1 Tax=Spongiactinospora gelatinilytica TaxID=2666298 RepID=A0A2W2FZA5_9ACTN|nr:class F sortase [Spongiactinospora gelatinilytica]PZG33715.1 class F sortase [Spongiactinospora gelatinilytica]
MKRAVVLLALAVAACGAPATSSAPPPALLTVASPTATPSSAVATPVRIEIPAIKVRAKLVTLGLTSSGAMETPRYGLAGWYGEGPRPGEAGPAVIAAHVDSKSGPDVFARLRELEKGAKVVVTDAKGRTHEFVVERSRQTPKEELPAEEIWAPTKRPALRLITCGGSFDQASGHYRDNVTVFASAAR